MGVTLLFVCKANICRSPSAVALFRERLREVEQDSLVSVRSAGIDAEPGRPWCPAAARRVGEPVIEELGLGRRTSCKLRQGMIERATLILCADRQASADVLRTLPSARGRLFTMLEGARLANFVLLGSEGHPAYPTASHLIEIRPRPESSSFQANITWLITEMNAARGQLPVRHEQRHRWRRSREVSHSHDDIPDAHTGSEPGDHTRTFAALTSAIDVMAQSMLAMVNTHTTTRNPA